VKKRDGPLVAFEAFDGQRKFATRSARTVSRWFFGLEAIDDAYAVALPLFVDLADLENNGRVRKGCGAWKGWAGDGFAAPRIWAGLSQL